MIRGPSRRTVLAAAVGGVALAACDQNVATVDDQGRVRLRLVLDGPVGAAHGGFYQAVTAGLYGARNLNVEIIAGGLGVGAADLLASGSAELALGADAFAAFSLIASGAPVRAVAAYFQRDTHALLSRPEAAVATPQAIGERPLIVDVADAAGVWPVMAALSGLDPAAASALSPEAATAAFLADDASVLLADLRDPLPQPDGAAPVVSLLADAGYPAYGGVLLAPDGFARDNAAALRAFIIGSAEGWRDYLARDPAQAHAAMVAVNPDADADTLTTVRAQLISNQIVQGGEAAIRGIGVMTDDRWRAFAEAAGQAGLLPSGVGWRDAFRLDYLPGRG